MGVGVGAFPVPCLRLLILKLRIVFSKHEIIEFCPANVPITIQNVEKFNLAGFIAP